MSGNGGIDSILEVSKGTRRRSNLDALNENLRQTLLEAPDPEEGLVLQAEVRVCFEVRALLPPRVTVGGVRV